MTGAAVDDERDDDNAGESYLRPRPVLRYHGGKWTLAPWLLTFFPKHRTYVEPYGGGASVLIRKPRSYAEVYNDLDDEIVHLFRVLRDPAHALALYEQLRLTPFARLEYVESFAVSDDPIEQARRTIIRSFMGFGSNSLNRRIKSGFRSNSHRSHTTPAHDWARWPAHIATFTDRLAGVIIENRDALDLIPRHDSADTLHYVDPPYPHSTRSAKQHHGGGQGYQHEMTDDEHRALAGVLHSVRGMVVLSGYACELYDAELYRDWERHERRHLADGARARTEVVWLNPACVAARARASATEQTSLL